MAALSGSGGREEFKSVKTLLHSPRRFPVSNGCKLEPVKTNSLIAQIWITHTSHIFVFVQCFQKVIQECKPLLQLKKCVMYCISSNINVFLWQSDTVTHCQLWHEPDTRRQVPMGDSDEGSNCCSFKLASHWIMIRVARESMDHAQLLTKSH